MGWWETTGGGVIGDAAADYVEQLFRMGVSWVEPSELPGEVRERLEALYVEGLGRGPTEEELREVLAFCR